MMKNSYPTQTKDKSKSRRRRALPLIRLAMDPNAKLNMPKTLENIGTIARNSFEDKHAPMYHVRNMIGSVQNAFLSGLRIAPHDLIIPSQYRIVDTKEEMVMKPAEIEEIKARAAAEATAEAEARASRELEQERRRQAFSPPRQIEAAKVLPPGKLFPQLETFKKWQNDWFKNMKLKPRSFNEAAFRRKAFGLDSDDTPVLGSRMNADNEVDPFDFLKTFQKVGAVVRGSIKSGQETIQHISDAAHSARKVYNTARFGAPRVLLPYTRAAVLEHDNPNKLMLITPRFLDVEREGPAEYTKESPMVGMGEIMNAFGVANPEAQKVQKQRIIIEKTRQPDHNRIPIFEARFGGDSEHNPLKPLDNSEDKFYIYAEDIDEEEEPPKVGDALRSLYALKDIIGAKTITEFLEEMKKDFSSMHINQKTGEIQNLRTQLTDAELTSRIAEEKEAEERELKKFLNDLFDDQAAKIGRSEDELRQQTPPNVPSPPLPTKQDEILGSKLFLPQNLLKPFMNQPNTEQLNEYFRENGDVEEIKDDPNMNLNNFLRMHALVAAINPQMYQELFNETLEINPNSTVLHPEELFNYTKLAAPTVEQSTGVEHVQLTSRFGAEPPPLPVNQNTGKALPTPPNPGINEDAKLRQQEIDDEEKKRISMHFHKKLTQPFMGKIKHKNEYYYDYGFDDSY